jgi:hypothetical protein
VVALAGLGGEQVSLKEDVVHLLLDEARVLEGDRPADPRSFSERLARRCSVRLRKSGGASAGGRSRQHVRRALIRPGAMFEAPATLWALASQL